MIHVRTSRREASPGIRLAHWPAPRRPLCHGVANLRTPSESAVKSGSELGTLWWTLGGDPCPPLCWGCPFGIHSQVGIVRLSKLCVLLCVLETSKHPTFGCLAVRCTSHEMRAHLCTQIGRPVGPPCRDAMRRDRQTVFARASDIPNGTGRRAPGICTCMRHRHPWWFGSKDRLGDSRLTWCFLIRDIHLFPLKGHLWHEAEPWRPAR